MNIFKNFKKKRILDNDKKTLGKTFLLALFVGIILILISIIINDMLLVNIPGNSKLSFFTTVINELIKNAGIAIIIAYFFTFVSGTRSFMDFIKDRLISIIITKDFLSKLSKDEQRDILYTTTQPSEELLSNYSGIKDYFSMHITKFLALSETHFRSSYQVDAVAKIDKTENIVYVDSQLSYRMYKVAGKIENLNTGFEDEKVKEEPTKIYTPDRKEYSIEEEQLGRDKLMSREMDVDFKNDPSLYSVSVPIINADLKNELLKHKYLDVVKRITEFGNDHWHLYTFRIIHPCDKFSIALSCQDGLIIKKTIPFGKIDSFIIDCRDENRIITILCNEWLEAGSGVAILIAKP
jgi:hypothetical protein